MDEASQADKGTLRFSQSSPITAMHEDELRLLRAGRLLNAYEVLGAHVGAEEGRSGVRFTTWAPQAGSVAVVGDFNDWDGRRHPMRELDASGVWEAFIADIGPGAQYKFEIKNAESSRLVIKTDPYARAFLARANQNAVVTAPSSYVWGDATWMAGRSRWHWQSEPMSIYEVHLSSWRRATGVPLRYETLAEQLVAYASEARFTHLELLPIFEHPLDESLGYQVTGYYAPTSRFGPPDAFRRFVDVCHQGGIGVVLDWVPLHFPKDLWALADFDGAPLYERDDPDMAEHPQWRTLIFNYGRPEVRNFLVANALFWLREFHIDGLRFDAVSSMLFLDDARAGRRFKPNPLGGRENLPAVRFLREMNATIADAVPDAFTIAEESTSWPSVSQPAPLGGLGFSMRWNMGWVHDTLAYLGLPWERRVQAHRELTFERLYAKGERTVLALSHDEVSASRGSLFAKMAGTPEQRMAGLRLLFTYQITYPGKKLIFMGDEFGQEAAWDPLGEVDWPALQSPLHRKLRQMVRDLNDLYRRLPALHPDDADHTAFRWIDPEDAKRCVISYLRTSGETFAAVVLNFSCATYEEYVVGVPRHGGYHIAFSSDAPDYGGEGLARLRGGEATDNPIMGFAHCIVVRLPAMSGLIIVPA
jgi:1,4-alpha-glucan branching enzyme